MPPIAQNIINILTCALAVAFVLWGLRLFKVYIIFIGVVFGGALGFVLGALIGHNNAAALAGAVCLAIVGGFIAWPLQKVLVFIAVGAAAALLGVAVAAALKAPPDTWWVIGVILFILGGLAALALYELCVIIMLSFGAAQNVFQALLPGPAWRLPLEQMLRLYAQHIWAFLLITTLYVGFGLCFQRVFEYSPQDDQQERTLKALYRRATYLIAGLALLAYLANTLAPVGVRPWYYILGANLISWPLIALVTTLALVFFRRLGRGLLGSPWLQAAFSLGVGLVVMPLCDWLLTSLLLLQMRPPVFYYLFVEGPPWIIAVKWIYSCLVFPALFFFGVLRWTPSQEFQQKAARFAKTGTTQRLGLAPRAPIQAYLVGVTGVFAGEKFPLDEQEIVLGRDPSVANLVFPQDQKMVSRRHAALRYSRSRRRFLLEDLGSTGGTFLADGQRLGPHRPSPLAFGDSFFLGEPRQTFRLVQ